MKGDFSRDTYRPSSQYSRVLMQQGRVQLDSDWNEQASILLGYMRGLTRDLFGPHAGPADQCGFRIVTNENRASLPAAAETQVKQALDSDGKPLRDDDLLVLPGRYYVGGLPVEAERAVRYSAQPGFPFGGNAAELLQRPWIAYLDVWEDFVSADQDPFIRETALNGVDTCGRARIRWQVRLLLDPKTEDAVDLLGPTGGGRIRVRANPTEEQDELCSIEPDARYRGAENQLYRVEIHVGGKAGANIAGASFKWSRDNGSVIFPIRSGNGNRMVLAHLGRDEMTTLVERDWVELLDDAVLAANGVGVLAQVAKVERDDLRVELEVPGGTGLPTYDAAQSEALRPFLRRWDQRDDLRKAGGVIAVVEDTEIELEDGIKVTFEQGGDYRAGDYWMIPARVATGEVEWPGGPDSPDFQLPHGPVHHYAPLASRGRTGNNTVFKDMRCCIARLPCVPEVAAAAPGRGATRRDNT